MYDVTLTVTNSGGSDSQTKEDEITINEAPIVDVTVSEISCVDAADAEISFNNPGSDTPYQYSVMVIQMDLTTSSVFSNLSPGIYYPSVNGANGCSTFGEELVIDYAEDVIPGFDLKEICEGESADVFGMSIDTNGVYEQVFQTANGCDSSHTIEVYVLPLPDVSYSDSPFDTLEVTDNNIAIPEGEPSGGTFSGLGVSNGEFDPSVSGEGTHEVVYTYTNDVTGCSGEAIYTFVVMPSTVGINSLEVSAMIHPNPSQGIVIISSNEVMTAINVYDITGKLIFSESGLNQDKLNYNWSQFNSGFYIIELISENEIKTRVKWTKE